MVFWKEDQTVWLEHKLQTPGKPGQISCVHKQIKPERRKVLHGRCLKCHTDKLCRSKPATAGHAELLNSKWTRTSAEKIRELMRKSGSYSSGECVDGTRCCLAFNYVISIHRCRAECYIAPSAQTVCKK